MYSQEHNLSGFHPSFMPMASMKSSVLFISQPLEMGPGPNSLASGVHSGYFNLLNHSNQFDFKLNNNAPNLTSLGYILLEDPHN